jgi:SPP1 gp7 family putative phage head morphogenesis protein
MGKLVARLERIKARGYDSAITETQRWQRVLDAVRETLDEGMSAAQVQARNSLRDLSIYEAKWQRATLSRTVPPEIGLEWSLPSPGVLKALVTETPIVGETLADSWDRLTVQAADRIQREIRVGIAEGQSIPDIARRIRGSPDLAGTDGAFAGTVRDAETLARTSSVHVSSQARAEVYKANSDYLKGEQWIATLDLRTCPVCGARDGQMFDVGSGPVPPAHPNCRCGRIPVVKSLRELGIKGARDWSSSTRASMDGEVSDSVTYSEWLGGLSRDELSEALGPTRARLFTDGELSLNRMVGQSGRALTLEQIAIREGIEI